MVLSLVLKEPGLFLADLRNKPSGYHQPLGPTCSVASTIGLDVAVWQQVTHHIPGPTVEEALASYLIPEASSTTPPHRPGLDGRQIS